MGRHRFPRVVRLSGKLQFAAVYDAKTKTTAGPLLIFSVLNQRTHHRLGLSVSRRVGNAVRRNRVKRLLREAFRMHDGAAVVGRFDLVIVVRPHQPLPLKRYEELLATALPRIHSIWAKRTTIEPC